MKFTKQQIRQQKKKKKKKTLFYGQTDLSNRVGQSGLLFSSGKTDSTNTKISIKEIGRFLQNFFKENNLIYFQKLLAKMLRF